ncbi:PREDICTED: HEAT repeat-containing protein 6 isoform X2 [Trachymyrmex septentrionalis]|uniref:HEAT repeat-containing protein 6 isoform X2 n=1 Tax=Trachymyrmex septentrionalis TaxID=34720 RepID=UPI00084EDC40|nr:PREDICTED: HEAT repeat-containing protein 6 isoform X2 [Trachymyrmex septentrionalis]
MASLLVNRAVSDTTTQFCSLIERLLSLTSTKLSNKKQINACLNDLNELDYRCLNIVNNDAILLLVNQLCAAVLPTETSLVQNVCKFLYNLTQSNIKLHGRTFVTCKRWILEALEFADPLAQVDVLIAIKSFLHFGYFDDINHHVRLLLKDKGLLMKHLNPLCNPWSEINFHALGCLEEIVTNKSNNHCLSDEFTYLIKNIIFKILSLLPYHNDDKLCYSKIINLCLHILHCMIIEKLILKSPDLIGEILGVVQAFLFYGIKGYSVTSPQLLRPAAMNLPERVHIVPKCKNLKNHKARSRKTLAKKNTSDSGNNAIPEHTGISKYSSDSDTSDTEINNSIHIDSKVRLGAVRLLQILVEITRSKEIFGYWPQIVATGSRNDARVLTRSILVEPVSKVRQNVLCALTELLIDAKPFLIHAEDTNHTSFITFFGTVCLMVKELHFTLSLILLAEKNVAVLTHALKCTAALVQGTPYERLKPGLATKLVRNCKPHIFHKDPTVRVAALSIFEAFVSSEPITQEILNILAKQTVGEIGSESSQFDTSSISDIGTEEEEIDVEDIENSTNSCNEITSISKDENACLLVRVCLQNISNKSVNTPVRLQSLKLMGRLVFNTGNLIFPHLENVTTALISVMEETENQVILHACRVLEIMSGCLANTETYSNGILFWNIIFESIISLAQTSRTILREAACDCLGSISGNVFTQLSRQRVILIITILFGAVRDEESAVRAAGLRALGMLVTLPSLEHATGFLMDLADTVCLAFEDKNLGVRVKSAWALANLCDCLSRQKQHEDVEPFPLEDLLPKLYHISVKATKDNDKVKCNAVRAIGTILYLCPQKYILSDTTIGLDALIKCAVLGNDMKVRWNACRALGLVLSHDPDTILPSSWKDQVFPALSTLICDSPNFKVRTNAAWALSSCNNYGKYTVMLWKNIVLAFENAQHVPSYVEYPHRDALIQQLCLTLSCVAAHTEKSELQSLWIEIGDHLEEISNFMKQFQETVLPEKLGDLIKAKVQLAQHVKNAHSVEERQIAQSLANIFEKTNRYDNLDAITSTI